MSIFKKLFKSFKGITPGEDPQDPGYDVQINYVATRDPTSNEPLVYNNEPYLMLWWQNANNNNFWLCKDTTADAMIWNEVADDSNILSIIGTSGWQVNTSRSYSQRSSPAFSTSYQPSTTNDTIVNASISVTSTLLLDGTVDVQVDTGSGFQTINQVSISGLAATMTQSVIFIVPVSANYQLVQSSGTSSIISINEISL